MTELEKVAYLQAQTACAIITALGMLSENLWKLKIGETSCYSEEAFTNLLTEFGLHHNAVIAFLRP